MKTLQYGMHFSGLGFKDNKSNMEQLISDVLWNPGISALYIKMKQPNLRTYFFLMLTRLGSR